jgi:hypothetical protein
MINHVVAPRDACGWQAATMSKVKRCSALVQITEKHRRFGQEADHIPISKIISLLPDTPS